ncbi:MAG: hypothetical protein NUV60_00660 [Patescibacteria group bacterium]|nr:hypothetical protein [Patescibacteria group bacterium]
MPSPEGKKELDAALERARIAREKSLEKHPLKPEPKTLEEEFGEEIATRMRRGAEIKALRDGLKD